MLTYDIHEAITHLSWLVERAAAGETFILAKAGRPLVKVMALDAPTGAQIRRLGFLLGELSVPDDFKVMGSPEIEGLFEGEP